MGSHGGATAEGQLEVLADYGITPESMGCEIRSSMETVELGEVRPGVPVFVDRNAFEGADVIVPINRVKAHTDFTGPIESGLMKMIAIGLGKQKGADTFHAPGLRRVPRAHPGGRRYTLAHAPIPFGLALVENGYARLLHDRGGAAPSGSRRASRELLVDGDRRDGAHPADRDRRPGPRPDRQGHQRPGHGLERRRAATTPARPGAGPTSSASSSAT